jgi:hypothetical protein
MMKKQSMSATLMPGRRCKMKQSSLRFLLLSLVLMLCVLAQQPRSASAATCPSAPCSTEIGLIVNACTQFCNTPPHISQIGTCTDSSGASHNLYLVACTCFGGQCFQ